MGIYDVIFLIILIAFVMTGFASGLMRSLGALLGLLLGAVIGRFAYAGLADWIYDNLGGDLLLWKTVIILIFLFVGARAGWFLGYIFKGRMDELREEKGGIWEPIDRLGGMTLGLIEGVFGIGVGLYLFGGYYGMPDLTDFVNNSFMGQLLVYIAYPLLAILPEEMQGFLG